MLLYARLCTLPTQHCWPLGAQSEDDAHFGGQNDLKLTCSAAFKLQYLITKQVQLDFPFWFYFLQNCLNNLHIYIILLNKAQHFESESLLLSNPQHCCHVVHFEIGPLWTTSSETLINLNLSAHRQHSRPLPVDRHPICLCLGDITFLLFNGWAPF